MITEWLRRLIWALLRPVVRFSRLWEARRRRKRGRIEIGAVLVLGGDWDREVTAVELFHFRRHELRLESSSLVLASDAPVIISSGAMGSGDLEGLGLKPGAVIFDRRAVCTVTNFTTLVHDLKALGAGGVCVMTSEDHLPRAVGVGEMILGAEGLVVHGVAVAHERKGRAPAETVIRTVRDYLRALTWIVWDVDMGGVVPWLRPGRRPDRASELAAIIAERKGRSMVQ